MSGGSRPKTILLALLLAALPGCESNPAQPVDSGPDSKPASWGFSPVDDGLESQAVALKLDTIEGDKVWLKLVGRGVAKLQGVAFRLSYDPQAVTVLKSEVGPAWSSDRTVVSQFAPQPSGELWGGVGFLGAHALDASKEVTLARLQLSPSGPVAQKISFRDLRNMVIDSSGHQVKVAWWGGTLQRTAAR